jgi:ZIP family zinc transporter
MPIVLALVAMCTTLLGGVLADRIRAYRYLVLGLAGGVMLGVVLFDILPEALEHEPAEAGGVPVPLLCFAAGFLAIYAVERSMRVPYCGRHGGRLHRANHPRVGLTAAALLIVHSVLDGVAIGAAAQASTATAVVVAVGVISHDFTDGFNTYTLTSMYGNARRRALGMLLADGVAPVLGAGLTLFGEIPPALLGSYLGLFAGFLSYLATSDVLPEAYAGDDPVRRTVLTTVAGVAFIWLAVGLANSGAHDL